MITDKLPLQEESGALIAVGSQAGVGKTSVLIETAKEFVKAGKTVAVISDDFYQKWFERLNLTAGEQAYSLVFFRFDPSKSIQQMLGNRKFDVLIVDAMSYGEKDLLNELQNFAKINNCFTFTSFQLARNIGDKSTIVDSTYKMNRADYVLTITKNKNGFAWYKRILQFLFPRWFKKPNRTINIIKNRRGKEKSFDVALEFGK